MTDGIFRKILLPQPLLRYCDTCDTFLIGGSIPDAFCLFPIQKDHPLLLVTYTQRAGILFLTRQDQAFFCHSFQQTLVGTGEVFALFLTEFADNFVAQFTVQIKKSIVLIPKACAKTKLTGIIFVIHICLVVLQQSIKLSNELVSRLVLTSFQKNLPLPTCFYRPALIH